MTVEDRYVIDIKELHTVRFDCKQCGTSISFRVAEWKTIPEDCPICRVTWHRGTGTQEWQTLNALSRGLQSATEMMGATPSHPVQFTVRFEMERPRT